MTINALDIEALKAQRIEMQGTKIRAREAAKQLGVSEAQYVALGEADEVSALNKQFSSLLEQLSGAGELMALTRNDCMVFEHHGRYERFSYMRNTMIVQGSGVDLRLRLGTWAYGFKVNEKGRVSLQFFNNYGQAVHKIYVTKQTDSDAFNSIVDTYLVPLTSPDLAIKEAPKPVLPQASKLLDVSALRVDWQRLENAHHFQALLKAYKLTRPLAYQHLPESATPISVHTLKPVLEAICEQQLEVMIFVSNVGAVQVHNGKIHKLLEMGPWFNVLDEKFNLHAQLESVDCAWCINKSYENRTTCSVEFFDRYHQPLMMIYLHPDVLYNSGQQASWQKILQQLPKLEEGVA